MNNMKPLSDRIILLLLKFWGLLCVKNTVDGPIFLYKPFIFGVLLVWLTFPVVLYAMFLEMNRPKSKMMPTTTAVVVNFIHFGAVISTSVVIVLFAAWNYKIIGMVYFKIETIETKLNNHVRCIKTSLIFFISIILMIGLFIWDFWTCSQINPIFAWFIPSYIYKILFMVFIFQLVLIVSRITALFRSLNTELIKTLRSATKHHMHTNLPAVETLSGCYFFISILIKKSKGFENYLFE